MRSTDLLDAAAVIGWWMMFLGAVYFFGLQAMGWRVNCEPIFFAGMFYGAAIAGSLGFLFAIYACNREEIHRWLRRK